MKFDLVQDKRQFAYYVRHLLKIFRALVDAIPPLLFFCFSPGLLFLLLLTSYIHLCWLLFFFTLAAAASYSSSCCFYSSFLFFGFLSFNLNDSFIFFHQLYYIVVIFCCGCNHNKERGQKYV